MGNSRYSILPHSKLFGRSVRGNYGANRSITLKETKKKTKTKLETKTKKKTKTKTIQVQAPAFKTVGRCLQKRMMSW